MILTRNFPVSKNFTNVFDELVHSFPSTWGNDVKSTSSAPVNIIENDNGYHLEFNVPGRNKEDFAINIDNGLLTVSYEKKEQPETSELKWIRKEFSFNSFKRSFSLNDKVDADGIEAKYENGVLKVVLPKKERVKNSPKQISIQ